MNDSVDIHTLTGAYALDALPLTEARAFARHLAECTACVQEVRELQATASRLAFAVAQRSPLALRERVIRALPEVGQLPLARLESGAVSLRSRIWQYWLPLWTASVYTLVGKAAGWAVVAQHHADCELLRAAQATQRVIELETLMAAPDAVLRTGSMRNGGITVVASQRLGRVAFIYRDLPLLAQTQVYQLWYSESGSMVPAGLITPGRTDGTQILAGGPIGSDAVEVTVEPAGGSRTPSGPPVMVVPLA